VLTSAAVAAAAAAPTPKTPDAPAAGEPQTERVVVAVQAVKPTLEIYGFGQADAIADFKTNDPKWYDVNRPSKLPSSDGQFGENGHFYLSPRQSRFGAKAEIPTGNGPVKAQFEFDMFGVGGDAGQTTIRLRHAYGQYKKLGAGQTNSQFMDIDVFPNVIDYWGPNGMLFFRNVQVFYNVIDDAKQSLTVAIENPGASGDGGVYSDRIEVQNIKPRFPAPDFTVGYRLNRSWGHVKGAGILRKISYDDAIKNDPLDLSGSVTGWGLSISSALKAGANDTLRLQFVGGQGIANYFNDAPIDVAIENNLGNATTPIVGKALPITGLVLYLDHTWNKTLTSSGGYSRVDYTNSDAQAPSAYKSGQYASFNVLCTPVPNVLTGAEFQWAHRENFKDGFSSDDVRVQFSFKYSFSLKVGGQ
jgi:hypothetical protein